MVKIRIWIRELFNFYSDSSPLRDQATNDIQHDIYPHWRRGYCVWVCLFEGAIHHMCWRHACVCNPSYVVKTCMCVNLHYFLFILNLSSYPWFPFSHSSLIHSFTFFSFSPFFSHSSDSSTKLFGGNKPSIQYTVLLQGGTEGKWILNYFGINHVMDHDLLLTYQC